MDERRGLETGKREQRLAFIFCKRNVTGQSEHIEQLHCLTVYFREDDLCAALLSDVYNSEEDRDADTVNELCIAEINHQRATAAVDVAAALTFDLFPG